MFPLAHTSKLLATLAEGNITLTNIILQFPMVVAYRASLHRR
jgi:hypothetical protein